MHRNSGRSIEHRFDDIASGQRDGPSEPAGDDDVAGLDAPALQRELLDEPDNTRRRVTRSRSPRSRTALGAVVEEHDADLVEVLDARQCRPDDHLRGG